MLRIPDWIREDAMVYINDDLYVKTNNTAKFVAINRVWRNDDKVTVLLPIGLNLSLCRMMRPWEPIGMEPMYWQVLQRKNVS